MKTPFIKRKGKFLHFQQVFQLLKWKLHRRKGLQILLGKKKSRSCSCTDMFSLYTSSLALLWLNELGSLSSDVFERRTSTGSEPFSLFKGLDDTKSVLLSDSTLTERICSKICSKSWLEIAKSPLPFDLRCSQTSVLINSLMKKVWQRRSEIRAKTVKTRVLGSSVSSPLPSATVLVSEHSARSRSFRSLCIVLYFFSQWFN